MDPETDDPMAWLDADMADCPVAAAIDVLGERWSLLLVRDALNGVHRFEDFRAHLGIADAVLADRLRKLVEAGILERRPYRETGRRTRHEYHPTDRGQDLRVVMAALREWGEAHLGVAGQPAFVARHEGCATDVVVELRCPDHPEGALPPDSVHIQPGPRARPARTLLPSRA